MRPADRHLAPPRRVTLRDGRLITVRLLDAGDAEGMADFFARFRPEDGVYYLPPSARTREAALKRAARADDPYEVCLVLADEAGRIHGEAWYRWSEKRLNQSLFGIGIGPDMQGVGAGRLIMTQLMDIGDRFGPPVMELTVQIENERAWRLYTSLGFDVIRYQLRGAREDSPPLPELYMERRMGGRGTGAATRASDGADEVGQAVRRLYWSAMMDEADAFMQGVLAHPVEECGEPMALLPEAVRAAGVEVLFSAQPHAGGRPRLYCLRQGLVAPFLAAAADLNARGWVMRVEDGYRTVDMQRGLILQDRLFEAILRKVQWEARTQQPSAELLYRRLGAMLATAPKVGTHMSGSAIDISIVARDTGAEVERGGPYLEMSERTPMETPFVPAEARRNRRDITAIMRRHGFVAYPWEFWHYNAGDAYAESLSRSGHPGRYGAVHADPATGKVTPIDQPTRPLVSPEILRGMMDKAIAAAG